MKIKKITWKIVTKNHSLAKKCLAKIRDTNVAKTEVVLNGLKHFVERFKAPTIAESERLSIYW